MSMPLVRLAVLGLAIALPLPAAAQSNPITQALRDTWAQARDNVRRSADVMPEAKYVFKPVDSVRSYGAILAHLAGAAYEFCAAAKGEKPPFTEAGVEKSATTRAAIVKALDASIAYCDEIYKTLDDAKAAQLVAGAFGGGQAARAQNLIGNTGHFQEHYGNLVTYLRINGLVPPSSQPRQ
jgi:uncharacterized damage-inducible protein DinB